MHDDWWDIGDDWWDIGCEGMMIGGILDVKTKACFIKCIHIYFCLVHYSRSISIRNDT